MTVRPRVALDPAAELRPSLRVARVATALDVDETQVRRLIDRGELEAHGIGTRGVRVYVDSVLAYQERRAKQPKLARPAAEKPRRQRANSASHLAAVAGLRRLGIG